jgi:hypothetical protein
MKESGGMIIGGGGDETYSNYNTHMNCPRPEPKAYAVRSYRVNSLIP